MKDIFESVKFGDKFVVEDMSLGTTDIGVITSVRLQAGFVHISFEPKPVYCEKRKGSLVTSFEGYYDVETGKRISKDGKTLDDNIYVVSRYRETIDEEKLDEIAEDSWNNLRKLASAPHVAEAWNDYIHGFKAGYYKAKEENQ